MNIPGSVFRSLNLDFPEGVVWLAGAGPGDPGLVTLQTLFAIQTADIIVYDALVNPAILEWRRPGAVIEYAGKRGGKPSPLQRDITIRLIELSHQKLKVLRLKGGDPFVFGRGGEEAHALARAGVIFKVSPGITAGIGGLAYAGIPATHRDINQALTFITGHDQSGEDPASLDWQAIAKGAQTLVMYMSTKHLRKICDTLMKHGRPALEPVAIVQNASLPEMKIVETTLKDAADDLAHSGLGAPTIICVGKAVLMRKAIDWYSQLSGLPPRDLDPLGQEKKAVQAK